MQFSIAHETSSRIRIQTPYRHLSAHNADTLSYYLETVTGATDVVVYERSGSVAFRYTNDRLQALRSLQLFSFATFQADPLYLENSSRSLDIYYREKILTRFIRRFTRKLFMPAFLRGVFIYFKAARYIYAGLRSLWHEKIEVSVLDGAAITACLAQKDIPTAGSVMFLLGLGDILEDWTHKKTVHDLARTMALCPTSVWKYAGPDDVELVDSSTIEVGDLVQVGMGNPIGFDGIVVQGEALVNEASLTGESRSVLKRADGVVYAGTVVEEGEVVFKVTQTQGSTKYEQIVEMIRETEMLKSQAESEAEHLADRLVSFSLLATAAVYLATRNFRRAASVLMVDYSCALKLCMPVTVLTAIKEAQQHSITIKGGKFIEAVAKADTIVFDKTGTLTYAQPQVNSVVAFSDKTEDELLRIAACLEEHFPHSIANAVVAKAAERNLDHKEMHSKVEYIVAHGICSYISDKRVIIGSHHFVFDDEKTKIPEGKEELFQNLPGQFSHLYLAIDGVLAACILIEDPVRPEAAATIAKLRSSGISNVVMMTGDSMRTAACVAEQIGIDTYFAEVLPEDKARFVAEQKRLGHHVIMVGDGINDSPALSASDAGIAISDGAALARNIADIIVEADNLEALITLKELSNLMQDRIKLNYNKIIGINSALILGGVTGLLPATTSAFLHNASTVMIGANSTHPLLPQKVG